MGCGRIACTIRSETVRSPTPGTSATRDTRQGLPPACGRRSPAHPGSAASLPSRHGRRPRSKSRGAWRSRGGAHPASRGRRRAKGVGCLVPPAVRRGQAKVAAGLALASVVDGDRPYVCTQTKPTQARPGGLRQQSPLSWHRSRSGLHKHWPLLGLQFPLQHSLSPVQRSVKPWHVASGAQMPPMHVLPLAQGVRSSLSAQKATLGHPGGAGHVGHCGHWGHCAHRGRFRRFLPCPTAACGAPNTLAKPPTARARRA